jgi:hypothetical protein
VLTFGKLVEIEIEDFAPDVHTPMYQTPNLRGPLVLTNGDGNHQNKLCAVSSLNSTPNTSTSSNTLVNYHKGNSYIAPSMGLGNNALIEYPDHSINSSSALTIHSQTSQPSITAVSRRSSSNQTLINYQAARFSGNFSNNTNVNNTSNALVPYNHINGNFNSNRNNNTVRRNKSGHRGSRRPGGRGGPNNNVVDLNRIMRGMDVRTTVCIPCQFRCSLITNSRSCFATFRIRCHL